MIEEIQIAKERATDEKRVHGSHKAPKNKGIIAIERKSAFCEKNRRESYLGTKLKEKYHIV
jgi:hypothetical protein